MFYKSTDNNFVKVVEGVSIKTLVYGEKMLFSEFHMEKGSKLPIHSHPQEQTGRLINGKIILTIGNEKMVMEPGDCWIVPSHIEHGAEIIEESVAIEVFSPVRNDYLLYFIK
jgi:quercetin dioxygenase-like cupin family protein